MVAVEANPKEALSNFPQNTAGHKELVTSKGTGAIVPAMVTFDGGDTEKLRLFIATNGRLCALNKGSRSKGYSIEYRTVTRFVVDIPKSIPRWEREYRSFMNYRKKVFEDRHENLYPNLYEAYKNADPETVRKALLDAQQDPDQSLAYYHALRQFDGIIYENDYKSISIASTMSSYEQSTLLPEIAQAIQNKECNRWKWRGSYDYSVSLQINGDGHYVGFFSQEFKSCGNGHYWLLISPTTAIFAESD